MFQYGSFFFFRDRIAYQNFVKNPDKYQKYGLPKHYGILYAMGKLLFCKFIDSIYYLNIDADQKHFLGKSIFTLLRKHND